MKQSTRSILALAVFLAITFAIAAFGSQFGPSEWYAGIAKPSFNPPSWIFGPVWTALYILMAVAAWLVWRSSAAGRRAALTMYFVQLLLNGLWSWIFFGLHNPGGAFAEIVLLWIAIALTIVLFGRVRALAADLLLPYIAWVSFAAVLNFTIWRLNA